MKPEHADKLSTLLSSLDDFNDQRKFCRALRGNLKRGFQSGNRRFRLNRISRVNTAQRGRFFHALAGLGDLVHADVVIDGGFLREPPAAEIAKVLQK